MKIIVEAQKNDNGQKQTIGFSFQCGYPSETEWPTQHEFDYALSRATDELVKSLHKSGWLGPV